MMARGLPTIYPARKRLGAAENQEWCEKCGTMRIIRDGPLGVYSAKYISQRKDTPESGSLMLGQGKFRR
ncbi:hypothetical protein HWI79_2729 [Cryptosporidium felis]|nr:hypothetical protein HWI79_2729 [Cryptosporidium felis]